MDSRTIFTLKTKNPRWRGDLASGALLLVSGALQRASDALFLVSGALERASGEADLASGALLLVSGALERASGALFLVCGGGDLTSDALERASGALFLIGGALKLLPMFPTFTSTGTFRGQTREWTLEVRDGTLEFWDAMRENPEQWRFAVWHPIHPRDVAAWTRAALEAL